MIKELKYFQNYLLSVKNLSNKTIESYTNDLLLFEDFLKFNDKTLLEATNDDINAYFINQNLKTKSFNRKITSIKSFYNYLISEKYPINVNVTKILHIRNDKVYPKIIKKEDIFKMINVQDKTLIGHRNQTIIMMLYITGLRVSELCEITFNDINFDEGYIRVIGKGNKEKIIIVGELLNVTLAKYINETRKEILFGLDSKYLFVNENGNKLSRQAIYNIVHESAIKADIRLNVTPHTLRHCFATHMLENGADIRSVQELLGHSDISTTQIYLNISNKKIKEDYFNKFKDPINDD